MRITLQIENVDRLETGGQVSYSCADRGFDIGRHEHLDWSLPDPQRVISGKHCEVRFEDGNFVLYDISTNGTFLNGSPNRMDKAQVLRSGDRLMIGDYIISVTLEADQGAGAGLAPQAPVQPQEPMWQSPASPPPPATGPAWPSAPAPAQQAPYPAPDQGGPWASPTAGMEGRHAPPSSAPGIGTPEDDVWSRQGHGWGNADPSLYDPNAQQPERETARPARADPLDHLANQPDLMHTPSQQSAPMQPPPGSGSASPFLSQGETVPEPEQPLFAMPDLGSEAKASQETATQNPEPQTPARPLSGPSGPDVQASSPFPEPGAWGEPPVEPAAPEPAASETEEQVEPGDLTLPEDKAVSEAAPAVAAPVTQPVNVDAPVSGDVAGTGQAPGAGVDFIKAFAEGAGIPQSVLEGRDPEEFARELGTIVQGVTDDLMGLLQARSQVKAMTRNANRTLISRSGNNALKFSPTPQMALQTMFSQNAEDSGYLPFGKAMNAAFKDIQKHHVWTYAAMQKAAARFDDTLSPKAIEEEGQVAKSTFGNQKAKLWERIQERWASLTGAYDDGLVGVFTQYFTESYEELSSDDPEQSPGNPD
ncbi:type VI secretion system-associated FHA domain protein TagH [Roseibium sp.]|uniref:type VI secretion system-associated FHA domain protein TagH n=1 Tax=Roseibium sp. TaxID=1936156 RepID=UPI003D10A483